MKMAKRLAAILCTVAMLLGCIASMACAYADGEQTSAPDAAPTSLESPAADGTVPEATTDAALQAGGDETTPPSGEKTEEPTESTQPTEEVIEPAPETNQAPSVENTETVSEKPAQPTEEEQPPVTEQEPPAAPEEPKEEEPTPEEPAPEQPKTEEPAPEQPKTEEPAPEQPKVEEPAPEQPKEEKQEETPAEKPTDPVVSPDPEVEEPVQPAAEEEKTPTVEEEKPSDPANESAVTGGETGTPDDDNAETTDTVASETPTEGIPEGAVAEEGNQDGLQDAETEGEDEEPAASPIIVVDGDQVELEVGSDPVTVVVKADAAGDVLLIAAKDSDLKVSYNNKEVESTETENPEYVSFLISASYGENEVILTAAQSGTLKIKAIKVVADEPEAEDVDEKLAGQEETPAEEVEEATEGSAEEEHPEITEKQVILHSTLDGLLEIEEGTIIELSAELVGFEEADVAEVVWMYRQEGEPEGTFHTIESADGLTYSYAINAENAHNEWHVQVTLK